MRRSDLLLYAVTDRAWLNGGTLAAAVESALSGGVTMLQLREKRLDRAAFASEAHEIKALCRRYRVPFIINDDVALARECDADGVHIGQCDVALEQAREILGPAKFIGVSAQTVPQAVAAARGGADYLGVGAVFPTATKPDADAVSLPTLREICAAVTIPVVAIGGVTQENLPRLAASGVAGVAVVSAIFAQPDVARAAAELHRAAAESFK